MSKNAFRGFIALIIVVVIALGVFVGGYFAFGTFNPKKWGKEKTANNQPTDEPNNGDPANVNEMFGFEVENNSGIMTLSLEEYASTADVVEKTATVQVIGEVSDPKIDWTVEELENFSSTVANPVTVTPVSDGSLSAVISCKASFSGIVQVKATLRGVGSYVTVNVIFKGVPSSLAVSGSTLTQVGEYYNAPATGTYTIDLKLDNVFHSVGAEYGNYSITAIEKFGKVKVADSNTVVGSSTSTISNERTLNFADLDMAAVGELIEFSISDNKINVTVNNSLTAYYSGQSQNLSTPVSVSRLGVYQSTVETCYYLVTVVDSVSGLTTTAKVGFGATMLVTLEFEDIDGDIVF